MPASWRRCRRKGATAAKAGGHDHAQAGAALQGGQPFRLHRLLRPDGAVRGDLLLRYTDGGARSAGAWHLCHRPHRGRCGRRGYQAAAPGCRKPGESRGQSAVSGIQIFIRDEKPVESIAKRLQTGGRAPVRVTLIEGSGREITLSLGDKFLVTPQIRGALKAVQGVVDVQEL
jgi:hypothetical protein